MHGQRHIRDYGNRQLQMKCEVDESLHAEQVNAKIE